MGQMIHPNPVWWKPLGDKPDGTYALFRSNEKYVELISDALATRSIWYYYDDRMFLASTSQRAIIYFLSGYEFNHNVIPWMLATGSLGPGYSWDRRLKYLNGASNLLLDRGRWKISTFTTPVKFVPENKTFEEHREGLLNAISQSLGSLDLDYSNWRLPLSGGYDSRAILLMLKDRKELKCITWGLKNSQYERENDAYIARQLAEHYGMEHTFYPTDIDQESVDKIFKRFLICGEGRVDNVSAYMDGFKIWKQLFEEGIEGIIRGDEGFGCQAASSDLRVRLNMKFPLLSDFKNVRNFNDYHIPRQTIPDFLARRNDESFESWRDRVYYQYEIPFIFAALNDLKLSFVEVVNPFLFRSVLDVVKSVPDDLRTNKKLFKSIFRDIGPDIEFATFPAIADPMDIFNHEKVYQTIHQGLVSGLNSNTLPIDLLNDIIKRIGSPKNGQNSRQFISVKKFLKQLIPNQVESFLINTVFPPQLEMKLVGFRAYIILSMNEILNGDRFESGA
jgi:hypothetical protein